MATASTDMAPASGREATRRLLPFTVLVALGYLTVGLPLAVVPIYVHSTLGFGPVAVGWVIAMQSIGTLLTRHFAGVVSDTRGSKLAVISGAATCSFAAVLYSLSTPSLFGRPGGLGVLLLARLILGLGESLLITGALAWCIGAVGSRYTGRAMVWVGIAMFGSIGAGAPAGVGLLRAGGFTFLALVAALLPVLACLIAARKPGIPPHHGRRMGFLKVVGLIWPFGVSLALSTFGFGTLFAFLGLYYASHNWSGASWALSGFGLAYTVTRLIFGGLPDQMGGIRVASVTIPLQALGLIILAAAPVAEVALIGAAILGAGYSLTFPALGVEAVKHVPPQSRGAAMGAYVAFVDIGLGLTGPISGAIVSHAGYPAVFVAGALASGGAFVAMMLTSNLFVRPTVD